ncbi:Rid family hydrolase [Sodalis sp. dw_96]|uniref:RidA family protein n=1 Tax=Sodalis sp. dw_96 TaxID=2719794 RepID=UPI001BD502A5
MNIQRIDPGPRMSEAVIHNQTLYYTSVPENLTGGAGEQTADALAVIDRLLKQAGSNKTRLLDVTIFLADGDDFAAMDAAWNAWVVPGSAPVRCTVEARLMNPLYKVEIKVIAAI